MLLSQMQYVCIIHTYYSFEILIKGKNTDVCEFESVNTLFKPLLIVNFDNIVLYII